MGGCSVVGCKSRSERKIDGISFHSFPKVPEKRSIWINATGRQNWIPTRGSKICSLHFDAGCLVFTEKLVLLNAYAEPLPVGHLAKPRSHKRSSLVPSTSQAALKKKHNKLSVDENNRSSCYPVRHSNTGKMAQGTLTEKQDTNNSIIMDNNFMDECRACLQKIVQQTAYNILEPWFTPWAVRGSIIADDLAKLADVEITELDKYPKVICPKCYHCLSDACKFMIKVQRSDSILRERASLIDTLWPQPILVNKTKNTDIDSSIQVEVKQEVLSEDENGPETEQDWEPTMDIKIEPEEIIGARISSGSTSPLLDPLTTEVNGDAETQNETQNESSTKTEDSAMNIQEFLDNTIKEEPISGDETSEAVLDLSLDCMLCLKVFNSISGLKAHVISQHSYKSVKRKAEASRPPRAAKKKPPAKHSCSTCNQCFSTSTDLMVHQGSHSGHVCYVCTRKFSSFQQLARHICTRRTRRAAGSKRVQTRPPRPTQLVQSGRKNLKTQKQQNDTKETKSKSGIPEIEDKVAKKIQELVKAWPSSADNTDSVTDQSENEFESKPQIRLVQGKGPNDMNSILVTKTSTLVETVDKKDDTKDVSNDVIKLEKGPQTSKPEAIQIGIKTESIKSIEDSVEELKPILLTSAESKELIHKEPQISISVIDKLDNCDIVEDIQGTKEVIYEESEDKPLEAESEEMDVELLEAIENKSIQEANIENVSNETKAVVSESANKSNLSLGKTPEYNTCDSLENANIDELRPEVLSDNVDESNVYSDSIPSLLSNKTGSAETSTSISEDNIEQLRIVNTSANKEAELNITHKSKLDIDSNENEDNSNVPEVQNQTLDTVNEMEVHLAINPLSKDTVMFDTEMDIVDRQSEKTEDCVNQN